MKKGTLIDITPSGIVGGIQKNEGYCIFGSDPSCSLDYFLPKIEECAAKHFAIYYNLKRNAYFIKGFDTGLSVKLNQAYVILYNKMLDNKGPNKDILW